MFIIPFLSIIIAFLKRQSPMYATKLFASLPPQQLCSISDYSHYNNYKYHDVYIIDLYNMSMYMYYTYMYKYMYQYVSIHVHT